MSESMVERVARAIAASNFESDDPAYTSSHIDANWDIYVEQARAAIEAMREPSLDMVDSACFAWIKLYLAFEGQKRQSTIGELVTATHNAMIDDASNGK